jgi:lysyl-tRNA synthetase class 2
VEDSIFLNGFILQTDTAWRPAASLDIIRLRALLLARIRRFFSEHDILEVDTPALSRAATTDPSLTSFTTRYHGPGPASGETFYLHTSPEYPMKRLLASGVGSIYQICKVFRDGESGKQHNPEFSMLEWYRTGFDHLDLMDEVERLLTGILSDIAPVESVNHWSYRELFMEFSGVDPFAISVGELRSLLQADHNITPVGMSDTDLDAWLDLVMTHIIEPRLGKGLVFVRDYPASQAALARLRPGTPPVAARFEVYLDGLELANGFHELADANEQRQRLERESGKRELAHAGQVRIDEHFLAALESGLPNCAGVALGLDRLLMIAAGADCLRDVITFPFESA